MDVDFKNCSKQLVVHHSGLKWICEHFYKIVTFCSSPQSKTTTTYIQNFFITILESHYHIFRDHNTFSLHTYTIGEEVILLCFIVLSSKGN